MILPNCCPASSLVWAAAASASGKVLSITGLTLDASTNRSTCSNSSRLPRVDPKMLRWFQKMRRMSVGGVAPVVAPQVTSRPPLTSAARLLAQLSPPTQSTTTSTPRLPVTLRISLVKSHRV